MVPDFDRDDARYHDTNCGVNFRATIDGADAGYTKGCFEGPDGWVLFVGATLEDVHHCRCQGDLDRGNELCVEPRFGYVEVIHDCPRSLVERHRELIEGRKWLRQIERGDWNLVGEQGPELILPGSGF